MRLTPPYHQVNELSLICSQPTGHGSPGRLDEELSMGADPNSQPEKARELLSAIEPGWDGQDPPPQFEQYGEQFQPPIYCATSHLKNSPKGKSEKAQMVFSLLRHGADLYQEFLKLFIVQIAPLNPGHRSRARTLHAHLFQNFLRKPIA
ncbi:hypothetical protein BFJ70_g10091 [Fusarium oxysporum]|nr:hypothetical protein BFJ70_g10091 [Fusarium oxysporum]